MRNRKRRKERIQKMDNEGKLIGVARGCIALHSAHVDWDGS